VVGFELLPLYSTARIEQKALYDDSLSGRLEKDLLSLPGI
jgi:hypothetical protein